MPDHTDAGRRASEALEFTCRLYALELRTRPADYLEQHEGEGDSAGEGESEEDPDGHLYYDYDDPLGILRRDRDAEINARRTPEGVYVPGEGEDDMERDLR